jgi:hypothetical protein
MLASTTFVATLVLFVTALMLLAAAVGVAVLLPALVGVALALLAALLLIIFLVILMLGHEFLRSGLSFAKVELSAMRLVPRFSCFANYLCIPEEDVGDAPILVRWFPRRLGR